MITLTFLLCAIVPFIIIFVIGKLIISLFEKGLDFVINAVFSMPEKVLDAIKNRNSSDDKSSKEKSSKGKTERIKAQKTQASKSKIVKAKAVKGKTV